MDRIGWKAGVALLAAGLALSGAVVSSMAPAGASAVPVRHQSARAVRASERVRLVGAQTTLPTMPPLPSTSPSTMAPITSPGATNPTVPNPTPTSPPLTNPPLTVATPAPGATVATTATTSATAFVRLVDTTGMLNVEVPATWVDVDLRPSSDDAGHVLPTISAAPNWDDYLADFTVPGLWYSAYPYTADPQPLLDEFSYPVSCTKGATTPYNDGAFVGVEQAWTNCDGTSGMVRVLVVNPPTAAFTLLLTIQTGTPDDEAAYQHILETFNVDPSVPLPTETIAVTTAPTTAVASGPTTIAPATTLAVPVPPSTVAPATAVTTAAPTTVVTTLAPTTLAPTTVVGPTIAASSTTAVSVTTVAPGFRQVSDDSGALSVVVPDWWTDINGGPTTAPDGVEMPALSVAPDLDQFRNTLDVPGLFMFETSLDVEAALAGLDFAGECTDAGRQPNPNPAFTGQYQQWLDCSGTGTDFYVLAANPVDGRAITVVVFVQVVNDSDFAAVESAFTTYAVS